jgi:hypothetical protein
MKLLCVYTAISVLLFGEKNKSAGMLAIIALQFF